MEEKEKKIKDLTGNREEKIAAKKPAPPNENGGTGERNGRPAPKRPFVRMAQPASQMTEHLSGKLTGSKESGKEEKEPADRQAGKRPFERPARQQRNDRRNSGRGPKPAERREPRKAEQENAPEAREKTERSAAATAKPAARGNGRQNGKPNAKAVAKAPQEARVEKGSRQERTPRRKAAQGFSDAAGIPASVPKETAAAHEEVITEEQLRADGLLFSMEETVPAAPAPAEETERFEVVGIRFRNAGKTYYFSPNGIPFAEGEHAILETVRGMEYGDIVLANRWVDGSEVVQPLKPVIRKATEEDTAHYLSNRELEERARPVFLEKVQKHKLEMQLVDVEYTFDNSKLCFYFTAEGRVDFRELVKDLAAVFRTRIELRQIGVRDEARLFGGLGICGRPFCCKSFLSDFVQVSIKMAKEQNLSLASAKISGSCGRLMCCLRYEQDTYERENAALPRPNSTVDTPKGRATVLESSFLTGKIKVSMQEDHTLRYFTPEEVRPVAPARKNAQENTQEEAAEEEAKSTES